MLFYHATNYDNLGEILNKGIQKRNTEGVIYLTKSPKDSAKFLLVRGIKDIISFAVELDESEVSESYDHSISFFKCKAYMYDKDIPPDKIDLDKSIVYHL